MKHLLITTIAAVLLVGCGESQQSSPPAEAEPAEPVVEAAKPEPTGVKAPDISIHAAARQGKIEAVKQHLTDGVGVNAKSERGRTPLHSAAREGHKEVIELLIAKGADVNAKDDDGTTPLDMADDKETADLLRKHGGKRAKELKAEGK
jgi:ankyrin repeat protein